MALGRNLNFNYPHSVNLRSLKLTPFDYWDQSTSPMAAEASIHIYSTGFEFSFYLGSKGISLSYGILYGRLYIISILLNVW